VSTHRGLGGDGQGLVYQDDKRGKRRVLRLVYEVCPFQALLGAAGAQPAFRLSLGVIVHFVTDTVWPLGASGRGVDPTPDGGGRATRAAGGPPAWHSVPCVSAPPGDAAGDTAISDGRCAGNFPARSAGSGCHAGR
jgi:hypothetical protein